MILVKTVVHPHYDNRCSVGIKWWNLLILFLFDWIYQFSQSKNLKAISANTTVIVPPRFTIQGQQNMKFTKYRTSQKNKNKRNILYYSWLNDRFYYSTRSYTWGKGHGCEKKIYIYELNVLYIKFAKREVVVLSDSTIEQNTWICDPNIDLENSEEKSEWPTHNPPC